MYQYLHHATTALIKMDPSESEVYPDIMLAFDTYSAEEYDEVLTSLNRGDAIAFNATLMSLGTHVRTRHYHLNAIWKIDGYKEVAPHVH